MGKCQKCSKYFQCRICNTHLRYCGTKAQFSRDFTAYGAHRNTTLCLEIPPCAAIVIHDKWMKEVFSKLCVHTLKKYVIPNYLSVLKLQNYSSQCSSCAFLRKIEQKLFWIIEATNEASATNSIMNLSHTLHVIAHAKSLCSILYSSGNVQLKSFWDKTK